MGASPTTASKTVRYFFDWEFIDAGHTLYPISLGMVCADGREYYAEADEVPWELADQWLLDNVRPHLLGGAVARPLAAIAADVAAFVAAGDGGPEFWGYNADYDWVLLCGLYGRMMDRPSGWPKHCLDIKQLEIALGRPEMPAQAGAAHHALHDSRWNMLAHDFLATLAASQGAS